MPEKSVPVEGGGGAPPPPPAVQMPHPAPRPINRKVLAGASGSVALIGVAAFLIFAGPFGGGGKPDRDEMPVAAAAATVKPTAAPTQAPPTPVAAAASASPGANQGGIASPSPTAEQAEPTPLAEPADPAVLATYSINRVTSPPTNPGWVVTVTTAEMLRDGTMRLNMFFTNETDQDVFGYPAPSGTVFIIDEAGKRYEPLDASPGWYGIFQMPIGTIHPGERIDGWYVFPALEPGVTSFDLQMSSYDRIEGITLDQP